MKKYLNFLSYFIISFALVGCGSPKNTAIPKSKIIVMGVSAEYPPFEFKNEGIILGFDIDVAKAIAAELNYKLKLQDMDFSTIISTIILYV